MLTVEHTSSLVSVLFSLMWFPYFRPDLGLPCDMGGTTEKTDEGKSIVVLPSFGPHHLLLEILDDSCKMEVVLFWLYERWTYCFHS